MAKKGQKIIRSHRERVKAANEIINAERYRDERISKVNREAFVECFLLEDIVRLYEKRLNDEKAYVPTGSAGELVKSENIEKFTSIISVLNKAVETCRAAIASGDYKKVWKAIPEGAFMAASSSVKNLTQMQELARDLLNDLTGDTIKAKKTDQASEEDVERAKIHKANSEKCYHLTPGAESVSEVEGVPQTDVKAKVKSKLDPNT